MQLLHCFLTKFLILQNYFSVYYTVVVVYHTIISSALTTLAKVKKYSKKSELLVFLSILLFILNLGRFVFFVSVLVVPEGLLHEM